MSYSVCVKPVARKRICSSGMIWVRDAKYQHYVLKKDRGVWETKAEAEATITEPWEIIVEELK